MADPDYKIKITKEGFDVIKAQYRDQIITAPDNELIFNSDYPPLKIHKQGKGTVKMFGDTLYRQIKIPHNVGQKAMFIAFTEWHNADFASVKQSTYRQFSWSNYIGVSGWDRYMAFTDIEALYLYWQITAPAETYTELDYFYAIFEDPIPNV